MSDLKQWLTQILAFLSRNERLLWSLAFVLVISFYSAKMANLLIAYKFFPIEIESSSQSGRSAFSDRGPELDILSVLSRNLFDSRVQTRRPPPVPEEPTGEIRPSTLNAELLGTVVFQNSKYSVALIQDRSTNNSRYLAPGDRIQGATVIKIERLRVIVQNKGQMESLEMAELATAAKTPTRPRLRTNSRSATGDGVDFEELGPGRFLVPQTTIDSMMGNLGQILRDAKAIPVDGPDGRIEGFKIINIKPNSIFERIGLKDGDILKQVNDEALDDPAKAMSLFTALKEQKEISIDIERGGSRLNYTYEIR